MMATGNVKWFDNRRGLGFLVLADGREAFVHHEVLPGRGRRALRAGEQRVQMDAGDCIEVEGGRIQSGSAQPESASLMLIVSPPGNLNLRLGQPSPSAPVFL